ncbi:minor tail protein [Mycobacterium phage Collard]|uniref:Minor tail protein n=1 Tax=Mycobacterium phage Collard TaxID=2301704 RepID=A0A385DX44_9CAUD|nr:minor tail protein [Mycobacterium phage Collard]AXQ63202.1 minor tail protein [Mycobacterium phage Collard]
MPRAYDRRQLVIDRNPLWSLMPQLPKLDHDAPTFYSLLIESIKNLTGIDLTSPETLVASISDLIVNAGLGLAQIAKLFGFIDVPNSVEQLAQWLQPHLFGQIPSWRLGNIPAAHIGNFNPELLDDPGFDNESTIAANPNFEWDGDVGRGTKKGSARTTADGTARDLRSNRFEVSAGQKISVRVFAFWEGLVYDAGAGGPIRLSVTLYDGDTIITTKVVSSVSPVSEDAADWAMLAGEYQVPAGSTATHAAVTLSVGSEATAGSVWLDDGSARKVGLISQELVAGLQAAIQDRIDEFKSVVNKGWEALTGLPATVDKTVDDLKNALQNIPQANVKNLANALADAGQDIRDAIVQALGGTGTGHNAAAVIAALQNIPQHVVHGLEDELADAGDAIADVFDDVRNTWKNFWNGIFKTPNDNTPRSAAEVETAAQSISSRIDSVQLSSETLASTILRPRTTPLYVSKWPQDDVSFPIFDIDGTTAPQLGRLVLIPVTATSDREFQSLKFGLASKSMTSCYVGVYTQDTATGECQLLSNLGDVKGSLSSAYAQQSVDLPEPISATKGQTFLVGILQVGGTAAGLHRNSNITEFSDFPTSYPRYFGNIVNLGGLTALPTTIAGDAISPTTRYWAALGYGASPPLPPGVYYSDNFNRSSLGSNWLKMAGASLSLSGNELRIGTGFTNTDGWIIYTQKFTSRNQMVKARAGSTMGSATTPSLYLVLRQKYGQAVYAACTGVSANTEVSGIIYTKTDWGSSTAPGVSRGEQVQQIGHGIRPGDTFAFSAAGNAYQLYYNDILIGEWVDSGGAYPVDDLNNGGGLGVGANSIYTAGTADDFEMFDI